MTTEVKVPTLGESITEATVGQWLKAPGDAVKADEPIVSLETDKVAIEVPSPVDGVMGEQIAKVGDTVTIGSLIARIEAGAGVPANAAPLPPAGGATRAASGGGESAPAPTPAAQAETSPPPAPPAAVGDAFASTGRGEEGMPPAVRRLIDDYNLDSASLTGTGKDGRLTKADVLAAMEAGTAKTKSAPLPPAGGEPGTRNASA